MKIRFRVAIAPLVCVFALGGAIAAFAQSGSAPTGSGPVGTGTGPDALTTYTSADAEKKNGLALSPFTVLEGCTLQGAASAGDRISAVLPDGRPFLFQLYSVEVPVADHGAADVNAADAAYFGVAPADTAVIGQEAAVLLQRLLSKPFTVHTGWEQASPGAAQPSYYAFVTTSEPQDLAESLVGGGLARISGPATACPDGTAATAFLTRLKTLEVAAKSHRQGAWGLSPASPPVK
jgi:hypothetical protein